MNLLFIYIAHILMAAYLKLYLRTIYVALCFENLIFTRSKFLLLLVWYLKEAQHSSAEEQGDDLNYTKLYLHLFMP